ncbi:hypothetical protein HDU84_008183 [Entophlyctis sp. JEL0112]|nr:hypothetical protein HDU84_008183 [Entophlyctis sp. JEL0112]
MSVNLVSFGEVLETEALFESFKQIALQNMAVEECLFWEAYKVRLRCGSARRELTDAPQDLEALAQRTARPRRSTNHTRFSVSLHHGPLRLTQTKRKDSSLNAKRVSQLANTPDNECSTGRCSVVSNNNDASSVRDSSRYPSDVTGGTQMDAGAAAVPIRSIASTATENALESDLDVIHSSLVQRFNRIYLRFIACNAEYQVNISGASREVLDKMYACGRWKMNAFEEVKQEVVTSMYMNIYPQWAASRKYP